MTGTYLQYVQATGAQAVNTGFIPDGNTTLEIDFEPTSLSSNCIYSARDAVSGTKSTATALFLLSTYYRMDHFGTTKQVVCSDMSARQTIKVEKAQASIGTSTITYPAVTTKAPMPIVLMAGLTQASLSNFNNYSRGLYYRIRIWDDGTLVRDLKPYKQDSDIGLWDEVGQTFYKSITSTALKGPPSTGDVLDYAYTGSVQSAKLPAGQYKLEAWGAQGGYRSSSTYGGKGGYSKGTLVLKKARKVFIYVGGAGNTGKTSGGFNGGGRRGTYNGGGGGSDIRLGQDSLYARVMVAGGGGSDGSSSRAGGAGGGTAGQTYQGSGYGTNNGPGNTTYSGTGSSTTATSQSTTTSGSTTAIKGGFGFGGNGQGPVSSGYGGAGGGGWYGGSGTQPDSSSDDDKAGAGGSGYVYTASTASQYPSGCLLTSEDYLTDASTTVGTSSFKAPSGSSETGHSGNGYVRITVIKADVKAVWMADGKVVRTDSVAPGATLDPPDVSKTGYTYVWTVDGKTVDIGAYDIQSDTTFTAVYTAAVYPVILWDSGTKTGMQSQYGHSIDLPTGSEGEGSFVGWWDGSSLHTTSYTVMGPTTLLARYDLVGTRISVDSVALQPNPVSAGGTVLISVSASVSESSVPRWTDMAITTGDGMEFSSPYQVQIWDTSEEEDIATFENKGIRSSGMTTPPLSDPNYPSPRIGAWSAVIGNENGEISWTITGTGSAEYTSGIVVKSSSRCMIRKASIVYTSSNGTTTKTAMSETDTISFPSGTYKSFTITVQEVSEPYSHVRVLNVAPGGA